MTTVKAIKAPEPVIWNNLSKTTVRKVLVALTLLILLFFPAVTLTDNGQMVESVYYFPWAIFRIFNPVETYNTSQLQMVPFFILLLYMLPTYYAIFTSFQLLNQKVNLLALSMKIAVAELIQTIIIVFSLLSGASGEKRTIFVWGQLILFIAYFVIGIALFIEKARLNLYREKDAKGNEKS